MAQPGWAQPPQARGTNGLAIAGFVLGLLWLCGVGSILGIVFGFVALSQIKRNPGQGGRGLAVAGIVLGIVTLVTSIVIVVFVADRAEDVLEEEPGERDDVTLVDCRQSAGGIAVAELEITNDSSRTSAYLITIAFSAGGETVESGATGASSVAPGETVTAEVRATRSLPEGDLDCRIEYVNRFASGGTES